MDEEDNISGSEEDQEVKYLLKDFRVLGAAEMAEMQREEEARMHKLKEKLGQVSGANKTPRKSGSDGETTDANGTTNRKRKRG